MPHDAQRTHNDGMLSVRLEHRLGSFHLGVDFRVPLGLIVLFGYSGAGKSLLAPLIPINGLVCGRSQIRAGGMRETIGLLGAQCVPH